MGLFGNFSKGGLSGRKRKASASALIGDGLADPAAAEQVDEGKKRTRATKASGVLSSAVVSSVVPASTTSLSAVSTSAVSAWGTKAATTWVVLEYRAAFARAVHVAGNFNDWSTSSTPLTQDSSGKWSVSLELAPGRYEYRFIVDGEWRDDPRPVQRVWNPFGTSNCVLEVL